jgi:hypothetical protein
MSGGAGVDSVDYSDSPTRVQVDLAGGETCGGANACGGAGTDTIFGVENVTGSPFDDVLIGNDLNNVLDAGAGNDVLNGGFGDDIENGGDGNDRFDQGDVINGNDVLNGGPGIDLADYHARELQVSVTLDGIANDGQPLEFDNVMPDVENSLRPPPPVFPLPAPAPDLTSPLITHFQVSGEHISPNNDGRDDVLRIIARFSEETNWKFEVLSGSTVLFSTAGQGTVVRTGWRGLTGIGTQAVSGKYGWRLTGTDAAGNQLRPKTGIVFVDRRTPRVRSLRVSRTGRVNRIRFTVSEPAVVAARVVGVRRLGTVKLDDPGSVTLSFNGRTRSGRLVRPGFYRVVIVVSDLAGNQVVKRVTIRVTR